MDNPLDKQSARLFFAVWPEGRTRGALAQVADKLHQRCGGRKTRAATIHLTLAFLGDVPLARLDELLGAVEGVEAASFRLCIDRLGYWQHNRIAWAAPGAPPAELAMLADELRRRVQAIGLPCDGKKFVPHITLLRKAQCGGESFFPLAVDWRVADFVLVRSLLSEKGAEYLVVRRWKLGAQSCASSSPASAS